MIEHLKTKEIWYVGTARLARLNNYPIMADTDLKKKVAGVFKHCLEKNQDIITVKWFDSKVIHLVSSYAEVGALMVDGGVDGVSCLRLLNKATCSRCSTYNS